MSFAKRSSLRIYELALRAASAASPGSATKHSCGRVPGVLGGLLLAVLWVRWTGLSWYPLGAYEPLVYTIAASATIVVALLASLPAAREAAAVQPIDAMRAE